jgi:hypothetical protein
VEVGLPLQPLDKPKTLCEVGEVGVVQQVGKVKAEARGRMDKREGEEARIGVSR